MTYEESLKTLDETVIGNFELKVVLSKALEKQIPKKPYKIKEHKQNDYYCTVCNCYFGDDMELKYACLQPEYCQHCGQAIDWTKEEG